MSAEQTIIGSGGIMNRGDRCKVLLNDRSSCWNISLCWTLPNWKAWVGPICGRPAPELALPRRWGPIQTETSIRSQGQISIQTIPLQFCGFLDLLGTAFKILRVDDSCVHRSDYRFATANSRPARNQQMSESMRILSGKALNNVVIR
jgi:hypothetical protein